MSWSLVSYIITTHLVHHVIKRFLSNKIFFSNISILPDVYSTAWKSVTYTKEHLPIYLRNNTKHILINRFLTFRSYKVQSINFNINGWWLEIFILVNDGRAEICFAPQGISIASHIIFVDINKKLLYNVLWNHLLSCVILYFITACKTTCITTSTKS